MSACAHRGSLGLLRAGDDTLGSPSFFRFGFALGFVTGVFRDITGRLARTLVGSTKADWNIELAFRLSCQIVQRDPADLVLLLIRRFFRRWDWPT